MEGLWRSDINEKNAFFVSKQEVTVALMRVSRAAAFLGVYKSAAKVIPSRIPPSVKVLFLFY
jgi:hypothetical protein